MFIVTIAPVLLPGAERLQGPREATPPLPGVITGEAAVITPAGTPSGEGELYPSKTKQQDETRTGGEQS